VIYLDNAATTFPKPLCMVTELNNCLLKYCGNPGRSGHILSVKAAEKIYECRETLADFFGSPNPENVVFTLNTTHALNLAIKSLYTENSHVLISNMEHNSVLRPIYNLKKENRLDYSVFNVMQSTENIISELNRKIRDNTDMLIMSHASNICGKLFPIKKVGEFCSKHNITFIVDAAQSAGIEKIDIEKCKIDALCAPAHKGLFGPQGLGFVIFGNRQPKRTLIEGGNGTNSLLEEMGLDLPESFEAGTMATPLIAALNESVKWIKATGHDNIRNRETHLANLLKDRLSTVKGSKFYGPETLETGIILYSNNSHDLDTITRIFNTNGICTRSGLHCAPIAHKTLSTPQNGALRFSFSPFNTLKEVDEVYKTLKSI